MSSDDNAERDKGLVFVDTAFDRRPATHVMIIGVGAFQSKKLKPVTSPPISARAIADWFLDQKAGFTNPERPLGSLALALSETPPGQAGAQYASVTVPRATFAEVKAAVKDWVKRANTHKDNVMVLFLSSHGESFGRRTAFLLEDYDTDPLEQTAGMTEIEQFITALENAVPTSQLLLFDCCRLKTSLGLPAEEEFGTKLISLSRARDDHGGTRHQWALCSTSLYEEADGRRDKTTVFTDSLLRALNGAAADVSGARWPVRPGILVDRLTQFLRLFARPDGSLQTPAGRAAGSFAITYPGGLDRVKTYVSLSDRARWPRCRTVISDHREVVSTKTAGEAAPFFAEFDLEELKTVTISIDRDGKALGSEILTPRAPVAFVEIGAVPTVETASPVPRRGPSAELVFEFTAAAEVGAGFVVALSRRDGNNPGPLKPVVGGTREKLRLDVEPGAYSAVITLPDGTSVSRELQAEQGASVHSLIVSGPSLHEWLGYATLAGALLASTSISQGPDAVSAPRFPQQPLNPRGPTVTSVARSMPAPSFSELVGVMAKPRDAARLGAAGPRTPALREAAGDRDFLRFDVPEHNPLVFEDAYTQRRGPLWAVLGFGTRIEAAFVPQLGRPSDPNEWSAHLIVAAAPAEGRAATSGIVESYRWSGLLAFLASRDFERGSEVLKVMQGEVREAVRSKMTNPLAAVAGALIAVGAGASELVPRQWLENITNRFPQIPDGPIILARRLMTERSPDFDRISELLEQGFSRGVPFFSLTCDWLARGLESVPGSQEESSQERGLVRRVAARVDPQQAFTVVKLTP
ncbi:hypothetical protein Mesau_05941 [Mesorhizobium australicum WSM2073]|uniref:Peptidase C14 caspase domain-containing protein n=3 Tax=Mesorhizobium TaxID=68287 RepID=L0KRU2_MESAW|nr:MULTISPECIES: caspase family protein [Mesorhizobium]ADV14910.1 hypothetical protein Mesci_5897 [Mesorhizobium ciceri biovar biserrulae WSM1271]AEH90796.1 hypothetical protein Mesop_6466 [Mesorhizobium opportunistum WSM2075]AGB48167.1 hypothetical protein Mesau_05941 [Mesorhizobium australicum WSM2073]OBP84731.1 hypothetical protein BAE40_29705 [Mesorhizobium loti]